MMCSLRSALICCTLLSLLSGCSVWDTVSDWMGSAPKKPLEGNRIDVLSDANDTFKPDESLANTTVAIPDIKSNENWRAAGGGPVGMTGNLEWKGMTHHEKISVGDGNGWEQPFYISPVVAAGVVYAIDAKGYVSANKVTEFDKQVWLNKSLVTADESYVLGGGVAFEEGVVYATSGRGDVVAMEAATGKELWKHTLGVPIHAAPKIGHAEVFILSVDNQLFALDAATGAVKWSHRGVNENAGYRTAVSPAIGENAVIVPYSSGEIFALDVQNGQDIWNDILVRPRRGNAAGTFSGVGGSPVIRDDVVYASGSNGITAAISMISGRRIWEQDIASLNRAWIADDYIYILSTDNQLICLLRADGRIKWSKTLPQFEDMEKHKHPLVWRGPVLAGGRLLVAGLKGKMLALSPLNGELLETLEIPDNITDGPIVAGGRLFLLTQGAKLHMWY